ncbi:MAG: hypothetical protein U9Q80_00505 [Bacillota bacterium]|nr:hypothetical protein [Bacillota bacterium]
MSITLLALTLVNIIAYKLGFYEYMIHQTNTISEDTTRSVSETRASEFGFHDYWIQQPSIIPENTVQSAIENQLKKEYILFVKVEEISTDEPETKRVVEYYTGSELAKRRGGTEEDLQGRFVVIYARYYVEYDGTKTFYDSGHLEQYFFLLQDRGSGNWTIVDNSSVSVIEQ